MKIRFGAKSIPDADFFIYNYTAKAQYDKIWNEITLQARGLI
jgi:RNA ligase